VSRNGAGEGNSRANAGRAAIHKRLWAGLSTEYCSPGWLPRRKASICAYGPPAKQSRVEGAPEQLLHDCLGPEIQMVGQPELPAQAAVQHSAAVVVVAVLLVVLAEGPCYVPGSPCLMHLMTCRCLSCLSRLALLEVHLRVLIHSIICHVDCR
jgi:hypothetical protein